MSTLTSPRPPRVAKAKDARAEDARAEDARAEAIRRACALLKLASDLTRVRILLLLSEGELNVTELCAALGGPGQPAVSLHLSLLRHAALVEPGRRGKHNYYAATDAGRSLAREARGLILNRILDRTRREGQ